MAKGYSARRGFTGGAGMMQQQAQMQQKLLKMQQDMAKAQEEVEKRSSPPLWAAVPSPPWSPAKRN